MYLVVLYDMDQFGLYYHIPRGLVIFYSDERGIVCGFFFVIGGGTSLQGREMIEPCSEIYFVSER